MKRPILVIVLLFILIAAAAAVLIISNSAVPGTVRIRPIDEIEVIDGSSYAHYFTEAAGFTWHHVELGTGQPIVFLHGIPGAWFSWHRVMAVLSPDYRTIAVDLKGLGLSDQPEGSYSAEIVANELIALMDELEIDRFTLVSHEWGSIVASYVAGRFPDRVTHFVRVQTPVSDAAIGQIQSLLTLPQIGSVVLSDGDGFVRRMYTGASSSFFMSNVPGPVTVQPIGEADIARLSREFSYDGIAAAILKYYQDTPPDYRVTLAALAATTTMPVLLLQADADPLQPISFYDQSAAPFPNAIFAVFPNSGHAPMLEQPAALAEAIRAFVERQPSD
ncbi:MAG: alpha/beta hydrolase [Chloroflexota bacterium]|nr:alpha/beta hydrolase [Chloroflexota bacterium]